MRITAFGFHDNVIALANDRNKVWVIRIDPDTEKLVEPFTTIELGRSFGEI